MKNAMTVLVIVLVALFALLLLGGFGMMGFGGYGMGAMHNSMMGGGGMMGGGMMRGYGYGVHPLGGIISLVSWALILGGIVLLVLWFVRREGQPGTTKESPLDILKARYARGEIAKEQFDAMRQDLGG